MGHLPAKSQKSWLQVKRRTLLPGLPFAAAIWFASCSGNHMSGFNPPPPAPQAATVFAFVSNMGSNTISAFQVDGATGALTPVSGSPFAAGPGAEFLVADPAGKFLFVGNAASNTVSAFQINSSTGMLTPVAGSPFTSGNRPEGLAMDPQGRFLFVGNQASSNISVFSIGMNGTLSPIAGSPFASRNPFGLAINAPGTVLFANNFPDSSAADANSVSSFQIGSDGTLTAIAGSPFATAGAPGFAASIGLAADHAGKFVFVGDHMAQAVVPFAINASGALIATQTLPSPPATCDGVSCHDNPLRVAVHPNDQFVFASNVQAGTVSVFSVLGNGGLSPVTEVAVGQHPFGVAVDPTGTFLFVANKVDNTISAFVVNSTSGMLSTVPGSPFMVGGNAPVDIFIVRKQ
jgi:6-phosphogluconolactonase